MAEYTITSTSRKLIVKRAGKEWICAGSFTRRGVRPGRIVDAWLVGRSRRCMDHIKQGKLYVANRLLPEAILQMEDPWLPLCLHCAVDFYPEFFEGPDIGMYLRPVTAESIDKVKQGLVRVLQEAELLGV